ncbi:MAG: GntR family transcriptional regulator [Capsulimonadaceae bacterium]|nr:GntR family transcriptional regulator [Capsulimonadaceae bacterium]
MAGKQVQYRVIAAYLEDGIVNRKFDPSRRLPSDMELARKFSASRPTVVRAMIELQNRGLVERRVGSGTYIHPSVLDGGGAVRTQTVVGLIAAGLGHTEILDPICAEITTQCEAKGLVVFRGETALDDVNSTGFTVEQAEALARRCVDRRVAGVFFAPLELADDRLAVNRRIAETLSAAGIGVVLLDREIADYPEHGPYDLVGIDSFQASYELGRHLLASGRRHIRFVALPRYPSTTDLRMAGLREAILNAGGECGRSWARFGDPADPAFARSLLEPERPEAIVCSNDRTAALLMQTLASMDIRIPDDIAVAGFDDVRYATLLSVPLTTMRQPCRQIGSAAVQLMLSRLQQPELPARMVTLPATLVARRSTAINVG